MRHVVQSGDTINTYFKRVPHYFWFYLFFLWIFFTALAVSINYYHGVVKGLSYPKNSFLPPIGFGDFFAPFGAWTESQGLGDSGFGMTYFPATYIFLNFIRALTDDSPSLSVTLSLLIWFLGSFLVIFKFLRHNGFLQFLITGSLVAFSYPSMVVFATGNLEGWIGLLLLLSGVFAYQNKWNSFAICIGVACAIKGVPLIFVLLPLFVLKYKSGAIVALKTALVAVGLTIYSLVTLPGGFLDRGYSGVKEAVKTIYISQEKYRELMVDSIAGVHYGHSFLNAIHSLFGIQTMPSQFWAPIVFLILIAILLGLLYLQKIAGIDLWVKFLAVSAIACVALPTSTDYKLVYLSPALLLAAKSNLNVRYAKFLLILTVFAITPKPWLYVGEDPFANATVYLTATTLLAIIGTCFCQAFSILKQNQSQ